MDGPVVTVLCCCMLIDFHTLSLLIYILVVFLSIFYFILVKETINEEYQQDIHNSSVQFYLHIINAGMYSRSLSLVLNRS